MFLKQACLLKEALQMFVYRVPLVIFKKPLVREVALSAHFRPFPIWMTLGMMTLKPKGYLQFCNVVELKSQCWQIRYENNSHLVFQIPSTLPDHLLSPCSRLLLTRLLTFTETMISKTRVSTSFNSTLSWLLLSRGVISNRIQWTPCPRSTTFLYFILF